jgi:hypothetical protein
MSAGIGLRLFRNSMNYPAQQRGAKILGVGCKPHRPIRTPTGIRERSQISDEGEEQSPCGQVATASSRGRERLRSCASTSALPPMARDDRANARDCHQPLAALVFYV